MCPPLLWRLATCGPWDRYSSPFPRGASGGGDKAEHREGGSPLFGLSACHLLPLLLLFPHTPSSPGQRQCYRERCPLAPREPGLSLPLSGPRSQSERRPGSCFSKPRTGLCPHAGRVLSRPAPGWEWGKSLSRSVFSTPRPVVSGWVVTGSGLQGLRSLCLHLIL